MNHYRDVFNPSSFNPVFIVIWLCGRGATTTTCYCLSIMMSVIQRQGDSDTTKGQWAWWACTLDRNCSFLLLYCCYELSPVKAIYSLPDIDVILQRKRIARKKKNLDVRGHRSSQGPRHAQSRVVLNQDWDPVPLPVSVRGLPVQRVSSVCH